MTNEEAIVRLARDNDDEPAMIAIAENNENMLRAAIGRYFSDEATCAKALNSLLVRISWHAKCFMVGQHDADWWIEHCTQLESRRLWSEAEGLCGAPEGRSEGRYCH